MQALLDERERSQLLFDLAVRAGEDVELVAWLVQATFDPKDLVRRLTVRDRHGEPAAFITALPDRY